ncbi:receptor-like protein 43 [Camellia sinensis]|uniref:receptor-like protein 43 n=1 Tax=Camellia sinensis TaxID=4442 RepID=UPI001036D175|nr:receptor-like protein 43 [Camellia sinensis]
MINGQLPSSIRHLKNLEELYPYGCNFSSSITRSLTNLTRLTLLDLSQSNFQGSIPLGSNSINGSIPSSFFHLVNLTYLDLSSNNLSGTVELDTFAKLEYLGYVDLSNNSLSLTTTNSTHSSFRNIRTLRLLSCNISKFLEFLKTRKELLEMLDLSNSHLNEELNPLCNLHSLAYLDLSNNQFGRLIPTCLENLELDISHDGLQGVLPKSLANRTTLEVLNVGHNLIINTFPFWLENLPQLKVIALRDNKFHGPIGQPGKRLAFTNLNIIDVSHNNFIGYEMEYVKILTMFKAADFSHNKFHGKILTSIGRLKALHVLNFLRNGFTGRISLSLVNLTKLESLGLSQNKLSGEISQQLTSLAFLEVFDVSQNNLIGIIPQG